MRIAVKQLPAIAIALFLGWLYFRTLAPGITWAFDSADSGDLVTAAVTGGVPHPSGYPTYLALASIFLRIPVGEYAYRTNLLSAVCTVVAALVIYAAVRQVVKTWWPAVIAAVSFGTYPLIWSQAIVTEVNALQALFVSGILLFALGSTRRLVEDAAGGVFVGLGLGNHLSLILAVPLLAIQRRSPEPGQQLALGLVSRNSMLRRAAGLVAGLSIYLLIPLRAAHGAPVNWGNVNSWPSLAWLISGRIYWDRFVHLDASYLWRGFQASAHLLLSQVDILGLLLILTALAVVADRSGVFIVTGWLAVSYSVIAILYYSPDSYVYLAPTLIALAVWTGMGCEWLMERLPTGKGALRSIVPAAVLVVLLARAIASMPAMDLSRDRAAVAFAQGILQSAPNDAVVFTSGDEATFALWYAHFAERVRPDVAIISADLLQENWYREVLRKTYPGLVVPESDLPVLLAGANPGRTACTVDLERGDGLVCGR